MTPHASAARDMSAERAPAPGAKLGDGFDATVRGLEGTQDAVKTKATTLRVTHDFYGTTRTFIVQTYRHHVPGRDPEARGDTILVECASADGLVRIALPPEVADAIARQRDALTTKNRRAGAARAVETRAERGIVPGFLKKRGGGI